MFNWFKRLLRRFLRAKAAGIKEFVTMPVEGHLHWQLVNDDGTIAGEWDYHNIFTNGLKVIFAQFVHQDSVSGGVYIDIGSGLSGWDTSLPPPTYNDTALVTPIPLRKATSGNVFLDSAGAETNTPTGTVRLKISLTPGDGAIPAIREVGVYMGVVTSTAGTGTMTNVVRFPAVAKAAGQTLNGTYDIYLTLVAIQ